MFLRFDETRGCYLKVEEKKPYVNNYFVNDEFVRGSLDAPNKNPRTSRIHPRDLPSSSLERLDEVDILEESVGGKKNSKE